MMGGQDDGGKQETVVVPNDRRKGRLDERGKGYAVYRAQGHERAEGGEGGRVD